MKDLVLQGPHISGEALDTFKVVCAPERITVGHHWARCTEVRDDAETRKAVAGLANYWKVDVAFVDPAARLADFRLLAMDMDSTLINIESLDEIAAYAGRGDAPEAMRLEAIDMLHDWAKPSGRDRVLARMVEDGVVSKEDAAQAKAAAVPRLRKPMPVLAPHSSDAAMATVKDTPRASPSSVFCRLESSVSLTSGVLPLMVRSD